MDIGSPETKVTAGDYLQGLDVTPQELSLQLHLPRRVRAKAVIAIPTAITRLEVNLVSGGLTFETDRIGGERKINVVHGHVDVEANADSYATLRVDVLMGSFHDRRPGGGGHRVMVSQTLSGTGRGSIEINVVRGSVDLKPWE